MSHVDIAGTPIKLGSYVCYAALWDRSATLKYGRVVKLTTVVNENSYCGPSTKHKVQVVSVDRDHDGKWELQGLPWRMQYDMEAVDYTKVRIQTLEFTDRMLVVKKVPPEAKKLLDIAYKIKG